MKYAAVIFDLFGTLVPVVTTEIFRTSLIPMAKALDLEPGRLAGLWVDDAAFGRWRMSSDPTPLGAVRRTCERLQISRSETVMQRATEVHLDTHRRWLRPRSDSLDTLKRLRSAGHKLGIVSGCPSDVPHLWRETPFSGLFDAELFSCSVGLLKPDPRLYALACTRLAVEAADCLYVGDSGEEIVGAREAGMTAAHFCAPGEKEAAMRGSEAREWTGARVASPSEVLGLFR